LASCGEFLALLASSNPAGFAYFSTQCNGFGESGKKRENVATFFSSIILWSICVYNFLGGCEVASEGNSLAGDTTVCPLPLLINEVKNKVEDNEEILTIEGTGCACKKFSPSFFLINFMISSLLFHFLESVHINNLCFSKIYIVPCWPPIPYTEDRWNTFRTLEMTAIISSLVCCILVFYFHYSPKVI